MLFLSTSLAISLVFLHRVNQDLLRTRALGLAGASAEAVQTDPMLGLLLAREAVRLEKNRATISQLHSALASLHERAEREVSLFHIRFVGGINDLWLFGRCVARLKGQEEV